jgi:hypothetical protein
MYVMDLASSWCLGHLSCTAASPQKVGTLLKIFSTWWWPWDPLHHRLSFFGLVCALYWCLFSSFQEKLFMQSVFSCHSDLRTLWRVGFKIPETQFHSEACHSKEFFIRSATREILSSSSVKCEVDAPGNWGIIQRY